jgi:UDP-N-acetylmuramate dehydrogenase
MTPAVDLAGAAERLESLLPGRVFREVPFAELTTYRLGGPAAVLVRAASLDHLETLAAAFPAGVPTVVVGRGSNLLVADTGFEGLALVLEGELAELAVGDGSPGGAGVSPVSTVIAGGGLALPVLARRGAAVGQGGLEFYVGIPGSVGGAVRMNAGGHGKETVEVLRRAWVLDLAGPAGLAELAVGDLDLSYRHSCVTPSQVVVRAEFTVTARDRAECEAEIDEIVRWRRANQPGGSNAGSVFTNPPGDSAGRLIHACGLKELRVGGAWVSERHANFFQAEPGAMAADVAGLVLEVQRRVEVETGVRLVPELRRVGFAGDPGARPGAPTADAWSSPANRGSA